MPRSKLPLDVGAAVAADYARELAAISAMQWTDADIPHFKSWLAGRVAAGTPLMLHPSQAKAAIAKGFVEHEHFEIIKPIPMQAISDGLFT